MALVLTGIRGLAQHTERPGVTLEPRCCWGTSAEYIWQEFRNPEGEPDEHPHNNACRRLIGPLEDNEVMSATCPPCSLDAPRFT